MDDDLMELFDISTPGLWEFCSLQYRVLICVGFISGEAHDSPEEDSFSSIVSSVSLWEEVASFVAFDTNLYLQVHSNDFNASSLVNNCDDFFSYATQPTSEILAGTDETAKSTEAIFTDDVPSSKNFIYWFSLQCLNSSYNFYQTRSAPNFSDNTMSWLQSEGCVRNAWPIRR